MLKKLKQQMKIGVVPNLKGLTCLEKYIISKSPALKGRVRISGSKNSVLPILAASLLTAEKCIIREVPDLSDVETMVEILTELGANVSWDKTKGVIETKNTNIQKFEYSYELSFKMRASFLVAGPLLARFGKIKAPLPGGCPIGARPVDLHLKGFAALGTHITNEHGCVKLSCKNLIGNKIYLDFPSVGATENIIMAAVLSKGLTVVENAAVEPEVVDLANFLNSMGAEIRGAGTDTIKINGIESLHGTDHTIIPDRIEAGTFMAATALTKGDVYIDNVVLDHIKPMVAKLSETSIKVDQTETGIRVHGDSPIKALDLKTLPYPGFPTDMQAQFMSLLTLAQGTSIITETIFENRFMHVSELNRMGAEIKIESRSAVVEGVRSLTGAKVKATDLRAGAALVLSALAAKGDTEISDIFHIERGYCDFVTKLQSLGAKIDKVAHTV